MRPELFPGAAQPYIFGHRGYSQRAPENTRSAFAACVDADIPGAEADVHRCASGELVLTHDHSLERLTGRKLIVEETSYSELLKLDMGAWFGSEFAGERIMRLEELFEEFGDSLYFDIELKQMDTPDHGLAVEVARCIEEFGLQTRVMVSSFNPSLLRHFAQVNPGVPTACIYSSHQSVPWLLRHGWGFFYTGGEALKPHHERIGWLSNAVYHRLFGRPFISWTVNDVEEARRVIKKGAVGIISDDPLPLLDLFFESPLRQAPRE
ncbi:MAG: glycerophosphodiester phosphodiesterase [bacterium]